MTSQNDLEQLFASIQPLRFGKFCLRVHTTLEAVEATHKALTSIITNELAEYNRVRALVSEDVWKYYEDVLGEEANEFREVKMLNAVRVQIAKALNTCEGVRRIHASDIPQRTSPAGGAPKEPGKRTRGRPRKTSTHPKNADRD